VDRATTAGRATIGIMATLLLVLVVVLVIAGLVFGVVSILSGDDPVLVPAEPDGRARPLPHDRSLHEPDLREVRFDVALRGYRMAQVDLMLRRTAYDLGYKDEMIAVLEAEVAALREGRTADAETLRQAREAAAGPLTPGSAVPRAGADDESVADFADWAGAESEPDQHDTEAESDATESDATESDEAGADAADPAEEGEQELPREGSLRRRPAHA
jgi:DivIVA domain-containing protein